ncbi:MAG: signal peptidase II [Burkholderiales bacterium]
MHRAAPWFGLAAGIVVADQLSKWAILASFAPGERLRLTGYFNLVLAYNKGAAFSFLAAAPGWQTPLFVGVALIAVVVVSALLLRSRGRRLFCAGLALILGGAVGNVVDRLRFGHVVDFLDFHALGWHWPAFNVADSAITVGAALLIMESFMQRNSGDAHGR